MAEGRRGRAQYVPQGLLLGSMAYVEVQVGVRGVPQGSGLGSRAYLRSKVGDQGVPQVSGL